jgi:predicted glycosyltransferase|tara:strand:+ start:1931 stop:2194 length:264 start_codon:yes stop_codon:yes gene_type:complete
VNIAVYGKRALIYSRGLFGPGHLRRYRTIARALVGQFAGLNVLAISGLSLMRSFHFKGQWDFTRVLEPDEKVALSQQHGPLKNLLAA